MKPNPFWIWISILSPFQSKIAKTRPKKIHDPDINQNQDQNIRKDKKLNQDQILFLDQILFRDIN